MSARRPGVDRGPVEERKPGLRAACSEMNMENVQSLVEPKRGRGMGGRTDHLISQIPNSFQTHD